MRCEGHTHRVGWVDEPGAVFDISQETIRTCEDGIFGDQVSIHFARHATATSRDDLKSTLSLLLHKDGSTILVEVLSTYEHDASTVGLVVKLLYDLHG